VNRDAAEYYAIDLGWPVFPLKPGTKVPACEHGHNDATTDRERVSRWWRTNPQCGIGVACTTIVVLDADVRDGKPGLASLAALEAEFGALPKTWIATTASGGRHDYFTAPLGRAIHRAIKVRPALDVLGVGGYVVAPPTTTSEGSYTWADPDAELAPMPEWIGSLAAARGESKPRPALSRPLPGRYGTDLQDRVRRALAYTDSIPGAIEKQGGHTQTYSVALALVRGFELPDAIALDVLRHYNARCKPPWQEHELNHKIASATRSPVSTGYLIDGRARS
jgi:hypothetical protein